MHSALAPPRLLREHSPAPAAGVSPLGRWRPVSLADVSAHRRELRRLLSVADGASDAVLHGLSLVFEELATNGVRHGGPPVEVTVRSAAPGWLVEVSDAAPDRLPAPALGRDPGQGGLGLTIVARLSRACGWHVEGARKSVWAWFDPALAVPAEAPGLVLARTVLAAAASGA